MRENRCAPDTTPFRGRSWLGSLLFLSALLGCYSVPRGRHAVDQVEIVGNATVPSREIEERIATAPSSRFFGIWQGVVFEYSYYDRFVVQRDIARIERVYRAKGFYDAKVSAGRVVHTTDGHVRVEFLVDEGEPVLLEPVRLTGLDSLPFKLQAAATQSMSLTAGKRFNEDEYEQAKGALLSTLTNQGYAWAELHGHVEVNLVTRRATVVFDVTPGPRFKIRNVVILGDEGKIPEAPVRRALHIDPGDDFSTDDIEAGRQALLDLGVFSDVEITWGPGRGKQGTAPPVNDKGEPVIDVTVQVTPSLLRTLRLGGGGEIDVIRTDIHGNVGWEDRNFFGGLRKFSIGVKPGVVLFPTVLPTLHAPNRLLPEERSRADLRQPGFIEARTNGLLRGEFNIYPVLLRPINEQVILGYREARGSTGVDRNFFTGHLYTSLLGNVQANYPFTYHGPFDKTLGSVMLRYLDLETDLNFRDNATHPHKGIWLGNNFQVAGFGGDIKDLKEQPDLRIYVPISRTVTFAVRTSVGFLFPLNYGQALEGQQTSDPEGFTRDVQLLYFRAFFSGGPNSNRGYPFRGIGPHGAAPFFSPTLSANQVLTQECNRFSPTYDPTVCAVPLGGLSLWESSVELRFPIIGDLTGAVFADASDVSRQKTTLRMNYPHLSTGGGLRYDTPVGPVRFDVGYRVPGMQKIGGELDPKVDGDPGTILGAPIAISIGVGQVF
ncbi:MAG: BamA/TamA family outer membrane protein [Deltaproteobacteria bacterium]|nr:BamA/TamA family outer membrane protein [Deltaproteobacteria bacterium]